MANRDYSLSQIHALRENRILRNVYLWMTGGLGLTAVIALGVAGNEALVQGLLRTPVLFYGLVIGEVLLVMFIAARITLYRSVINRGVVRNNSGLCEAG